MLANTLSAFDLTTVVTLMNDVALFLTIAIVALAVLFAILVYAYQRKAFKNYLKIATSALTGYAVGILSLFFSVKIAEYAYEGYFTTTFWLIAGLLILTVALILIGFAIRLIRPRSFRLFLKIGGTVFGLYALSVLIYSMVLDFQSGAYDAWTQTALYFLTLLLFAIPVAISLIFGKKHNAPATKVVAFGGVTVATSFALSYIQFFKLNAGGSITLASLLPIMIFAYIFGMRKGLAIGILYGFLQFIQAPWFYHPMQFLLDYPIAFSAIVFAGLFKELKLFQKKPLIQFMLGALCASVLRYFAHVVSGIFVFGSGDPENYSAVAWSCLYNAFVFADMGIAVVAGALLFGSKTFLHQLETIAFTEKPRKSTERSADDSVSDGTYGYETRFGASQDDAPAETETIDQTVRFERFERTEPSETSVFNADDRTADSVYESGSKNSYEPANTED